MSIPTNFGAAHVFIDSNFLAQRIDKGIIGE
jgi:hypothetical protein